MVVLDVPQGMSGAWPHGRGGLAPMAALRGGRMLPAIDA